MTTRNGSGRDETVLIDLPALKAEALALHLDDLDAQVPVAGVKLHLGNVRVEIKSLEAQLRLEVRLDDVAAIVDRVMTAESSDGGDGDGGADAASANGDGGGGAKLAKLAARAVAHEIGSAASDEAKVLGLAATRKVRELGERRRQRLAEKHNATPSALAVAEEFGVDLDGVEGTGADGRITVRDVREAAAVT
ncbi:MAG TPA: E3 binding domain-containing protein [Solirubrobacteraceae bacterium]|jgi:pyruvate/2-oxoglutarate dehydrogenase complex dihydrolipoamide acyltransferase (E2) component